MTISKGLITQDLIDEVGDDYVCIDYVRDGWIACFQFDEISMLKVVYAK